MTGTRQSEYTGADRGRKATAPPGPGVGPPGPVTRVSPQDSVAAYEKALIRDALKTARGNRATASRLLNTTERIINYQVRKYSIDYRRFKN